MNLLLIPAILFSLLTLIDIIVVIWAFKIGLLKIKSQD
jgi:hypothetical protein